MGFPTVLRGWELNPACEIMLFAFLQFPGVSDYVFPDMCSGLGV